MDNSVRHIILWCKYHYESSSDILDEMPLEDIIAEITCKKSEAVTANDKIFWLLEACKAVNIDGYKIIDKILNKKDIYIYKNSPMSKVIIHSLLGMLSNLKTTDKEGNIIIDLGAPDLFDN